MLAVAAAAAAGLSPIAAPATETKRSLTMSDRNESQMLRDLLAREAVRELRARYGWHAARGDYEGIVSLFTPDGMFEVKYQGERRLLRGQDAIRTFLGATMVPRMVFPMIHNDLVTIEGDTAHGSCAMESRSPDGTGGFSGYYHDKARLHEGRWLFTERRWFLYIPEFERSGLGLDGKPETGLAAIHDRKAGQTE
jgi:hypothetical protein